MKIYKQIVDWIKKHDMFMFFGTLCFCLIFVWATWIYSELHEINRWLLYFAEIIAVVWLIILVGGCVIFVFTFGR